MVGEPVDVLAEAVAALRLQRLHDPGVELAPPLLQEALVGHLIGQRVLEGVFQLGEEARLVEELGRLQEGESPPQVRLGHVGDGLEKRKRHFRPDHRRGLEQPLFVRWQPIDTGRQHGLHRGRDLDRRERLDLSIGPALADQHLRLDQRADALLEEEGIPLRALDQEPAQRLQAGIVAQERVQQLGRALVRQRIEAELRVVGPASPRVVILGAIVDEQQEPRRRKAVDEAVEEGLRLGVDPVEVLEHRQQRPDLALPQQQALQGVERALPSLGGIEGRKRAVRGERVQQRQQGRDGVPQALVERQHVPGDLGADRARVVAVRDLEVRLEEIDDRQVRGRLPVRHGEALEDEPSLGAMGMDELVEEAGLPHAGLPDDGHDLAVPAAGSLEGPLEQPPTHTAAAPGSLEGALQLLHLDVAPDEPGEPLGGGGAQARPQGSSPDQLVGLDRRPTRP